MCRVASLALAPCMVVDRGGRGRVPCREEAELASELLEVSSRHTAGQLRYCNVGGVGVGVDEGDERGRAAMM